MWGAANRTPLQPPDIHTGRTEVRTSADLSLRGSYGPVRSLRVDTPSVILLNASTHRPEKAISDGG